MRAHRPIEATRGKEERGPTSEYLGLKGAVLVASDRNAHVRNNLELHDERCEGGRLASCAIDWCRMPKNELFKYFEND